MAHTDQRARERDGHDELRGAGRGEHDDNGNADLPAYPRAGNDGPARFTGTDASARDFSSERCCAPGPSRRSVRLARAGYIA